MNAVRDLVGYGAEPPTGIWPNGARIAVSIVVNYEEGSEQGVAQGDPTQETLSEWGAYPFPDGIRNLAMESMYEYGSRVGVWRILNTLRDCAVPATFFACARAFEAAPDVARAVVAAGHEVCSHGWRWEEVFRLSEEEEREHIRLAIASFERTCGRRPVGWYCRYGPSERTRRLLVEEGGFLYDSDSYSDDVPYTVDVDGTPQLVLPYSADTNDIQMWLAEPLTTSEAFFTYLRDSLDELYRESVAGPRMMSVGLHCRIIGRPGRVVSLRRFIEYAKQIPGVWFATREEIAHAWLDIHPGGNRTAPDTPVTRVARDTALPGAHDSDAWAGLLIDAEQVAHARSTIGMSHVPAGQSSPSIRHTTEEACIVVRGNGYLRTDLGDVPFGPGDALHIPAYRWHSIVNTGEQPVEMVFSYPGSRQPRTDVHGEAVAPPPSPAWP